MDNMHCFCGEAGVDQSNNQCFFTTAATSSSSELENINKCRHAGWVASDSWNKGCWFTFGSQFGTIRTLYINMQKLKWFSANRKSLHSLIQQWQPFEKAPHLFLSRHSTSPSLTCFILVFLIYYFSGGNFMLSSRDFERI